MRAAPFLVLALVVSGPARATVDCAEGFSAFTATVYAKVDRDCALCHDGSNARAPAFAAGDPEASYFQLLNYVNFGEADHSLLVFRAGNSHCQLDNCNAASGRDMLAQVNAWRDGGEMKCQRNGRFFSPELAIPASLPGPGDDFAPMIWDLGGIDSHLRGVSMQVEVQRFAPSATGVRGAYRLRQPRLMGGTSPVHIKGMRVLVNRYFDGTSDTYVDLDRVTSPAMQGAGGVTHFPVLSAEPLIALAGAAGDGDKLSLSFDEIGTAPAAACKARPTFMSLIAPRLAANCASCHGGTTGPGTAPANAAFNMAVAPAALCAAALERVDFQQSLRSPLFAFGVRGIFGHSPVNDGAGAFLDDLEQWMNEEK